MITSFERKLGATRTVFLTRKRAIKIAGHWTFDHWRWWWPALLTGLLSNMQERNFAATNWPELCPISFYIPGGLMLIMPRARRLTEEEWRHFDYRAFVTRGSQYAADNFEQRAIGWQRGTSGGIGQPLAGLFLGGAEPEGMMIPAEYKLDSFGVLNGRIIAVDYG